MKKKRKRIINLVAFLKDHSTISIEDLASYYHVSEMTIRRDLSFLKTNSLVEIENGIVIFNQKAAISFPLSQEYNLNSATELMRKEKKRIGKFAASLINPNETVIFDTGTTTEQIVQNLPKDFPFKVFCYNVNILSELLLYSNVEIMFAGGRYHPSAQMFESPQGIELIESFRSHKIFLSAAGIHEKMGITCVNDYEVATKQAAIRTSLEKILVADSQKFGVLNSAFVCTLEEIDTVITDTGLSPEWIQILKDQKKKLYLV